jgi:hypothetical protein
MNCVVGLRFAQRGTNPVISWMLDASEGSIRPSKPSSIQSRRRGRRRGGSRARSGSGIPLSSKLFNRARYRARARARCLKGGRRKRGRKTRTRTSTSTIGEGNPPLFKLFNRARYRARARSLKGDRRKEAERRERALGAPFRAASRRELAPRRPGCR